MDQISHEESHISKCQLFTNQKHEMTWMESGVLIISESLHGHQLKVDVLKTKYVLTILKKQKLEYTSS
jgi:hypothetical protein